jgi:hypothetical protein
MDFFELQQLCYIPCSWSPCSHTCNTSGLYFSAVKVPLNISNLSIPNLTLKHAVFSYIMFM